MPNLLRHIWCLVTFNSTLNKNILYLALVQGSSYILPLITFPYLVRVLGPEFFGLLGFCQASMQYLVLVTDYGFNWTATQQIAKNKNDKHELTQIFWSVIFAKFFLALFAFIILLIACLFIPQYNSVWYILLAFSPLVIGNIIYPVWFFQGIEKMKWITLCTISARCCVIPLTFIFVSSQKDIWLAALIQGSVNFIAGSIGLFLIVNRGWVSGFCFNLTQIKLSLINGWHVFLSTSAISLYTISTTVILGFVAGPVAVGIFNAANTIRNAAQGLLSPITQAIYPRINTLFDNEYQAALSLIRKCVRYVGGLAFIGSILLFILSPWLIEFGAGVGYEKSVDVLRLIAFLPFVVILSNIFGVQTMLTHNYKKQFSRILLASGVINLIIIYPLIYYYSEVGAAVSLLITESFVTISMYLFLRYKHIYIIK
ncbi:flippase [Enterobacter sp. K16B]|uniref:flippase n=1 Tax=Enterobacter sp. K16B TaxID=2878537 RepID=UPI002982950B|nr:flippase [Enterobacter sp. K16B]